MKPTSPRPKQSVRRRLWKALRILLALYVTSALGCAALQRRLIYFPSNESPDAMDRLAKSKGLERWKNSAGENIGWKRMTPHPPAQGQVLITHGNGGCGIDRVDFANPLRESAAMDVFILEYPGFGDRPGSPTETSLFESAEDAFQSLPKTAPIYLLGESLGTGVAAYLAGAHPNEISGLLLFAPYNSLVDVGQHHIKILPATLIMRDRYVSEEHLKNYQGPVAIIVGGRDMVVPKKFGRRLYDGYAGPKQIWEIPDGTHESIHNEPPEFWRDLTAFWQSNAVPAKPIQ